MDIGIGDIVIYLKENIILKGIVQHTNIFKNIYYILIIKTLWNESSLNGMVLQVEREFITLEKNINNLLDSLKNKCQYNNTLFYLNLDSEDKYYKLSFKFLDSKKHLKSIENKRFSPILHKLPEEKDYNNIEQLFTCFIPTDASQSSTSSSTKSGENVNPIFKEYSEICATLYIIFKTCNKTIPELPEWTNVIGWSLRYYKTINKLFSNLPFNPNGEQHIKLQNLLEKVKNLLNSDLQFESLDQNDDIIIEFIKQMKTLLLSRIPGKYKQFAEKLLNDILNFNPNSTNNYFKYYQKRFKIIPTYDKNFVLQTFASASTDLIIQVDEYNLNNEKIVADVMQIMSCLLDDNSSPQLDYGCIDKRTEKHLFFKFILFFCWAIAESPKNQPSTTGSTSTKKKSGGKVRSTETIIQNPTSSPFTFPLLKNVDRQEQIYQRPYYNNAAVIPNIEEQHGFLYMFYKQQQELLEYFKVRNGTLFYALGPVLTHLLYEILPESVMHQTILHWVKSNPHQFINFDAWCKKNLKNPENKLFSEKLSSFRNYCGKIVYFYQISFTLDKLDKKIESVSINYIPDTGDTLFVKVQEENVQYYFIPQATVFHSSASAYYGITNYQIAQATCTPVFTKTDLEFNPEKVDPSLRKLSPPQKTSLPSGDFMENVLKKMWEMEYNPNHLQYNVSFIAIYVESNSISNVPSSSKQSPPPQSSNKFAFWLVRCRGYALKNVEPFLGFYLLMADTCVAYPMLTMMTYNAWKMLGNVSYSINIFDKPVWVYANRFVKARPYFENKPALYNLSKQIFIDLYRTETIDECFKNIKLWHPKMITEGDIKTQKACIDHLLDKSKELTPENFQYMKDLLEPVTLPTQTNQPSSSLQSFAQPLKIKTIASDKLIFYKLFVKPKNPKSNPDPTFHIPVFIGYPYIFIHELLKHADYIRNWQPPKNPTLASPEYYLGTDVFRIEEAQNTLNKLITPDLSNIYSIRNEEFKDIFYSISNGVVIPSKTHDYVFNTRDLLFLLLLSIENISPHSSPQSTGSSTSSRPFSSSGPSSSSSTFTSSKPLSSSEPSSSSSISFVNLDESLKLKIVAKLLEYKLDVEYYRFSFFHKVDQYISISSSNYTFETKDGNYILEDISFISKRNNIKTVPGKALPLPLIYHPAPKNKNSNVGVNVTYNFKHNEKLKFEIEMFEDKSILTGQVQPIKMCFGTDPKFKSSQLYSVKQYVWFQHTKTVEEISKSTGQTLFIVFGYEIDTSVYGNELRYILPSDDELQYDCKLKPVYDIIIPEFPDLYYWQLEKNVSNQTDFTELRVHRSVFDFSKQLPIMPGFYALPFD